MILVLASLFLQAPPSLPVLALDTYPPSAREAIARVHRDAVARPDDADAVGALARMLQAWEQWDAAHQAYARCQALAPKTFEWHYLDAIVLQRLARHADAAAALRRALAIDGTYLAARVKLAEALFEAQEIAESRRLFEQLLKEPDAEPSVQLGLARIDAREGKHREAIARIKRAIELYPEFGPAYYALALSYRATGQPEEAQRALAEHTRLGPRWPAVPDPLRDKIAALRTDAVASVQRGVRLAEQGDLAGAIAAHETAVSADPKYLQARVNLISLYGRAGDMPKAEEHYRAAIAIDPRQPDVHYDYGVLMGMQEQWDRASAAYREAIALNPLHAQARNNLGQILERERKLDEAEAMYRAAVESQPAFRLARFNLGRMLIALNRPADAVTELEKLLEPRDQETPRYVFALAAAHLRAGQKDEGIRRAHQAKQLAIEFGQTDLAAAIDRDLAKIR